MTADISAIISLRSFTCPMIIPNQYYLLEKIRKFKKKTLFFNATQ